MKILLIDENVAFAAYLTEYFTGKGFDIKTATDGYEGFKCAFRESFDVILLDAELSMPGTKFLKKLRINGIKIPVIMIADEKNTEKCVLYLEYGADDYMVKPFGADELAARIKSVTGKKTAVCEFGDIVMDYDKKTIRTASGEKELSEGCWGVMDNLVKNSSNIIKPEKLAMGTSCCGSDWVDSAVEYIKQKLSELGSGIKIFRINGLGYKICVNE